MPQWQKVGEVRHLRLLVETAGIIYFHSELVQQ